MSLLEELLVGSVGLPPRDNDLALVHPLAGIDLAQSLRG